MAEISPFEPRGDFFDGEFHWPEHTTGEIAIQDPGDLDRFETAIPFSGTAVEAAVESARRAYPAWRDLPAAARAELLRRFGRILEEAGESLAAVISTEVGKPVWEARTEVAAMCAKIEITLREGLEPIRDVVLETGAGQIARCRAHARGVAAVLGPFNFPGHLVHGHVVPALATGNTVVLKPSEQTPCVGQLYAELAQRAGFPPGVVNLVQGDGTVGAALAEHPGVDAVLFTGSYAIGRRILEATLDQPYKIVALEMGGKNAVLVCEDADLDAAAAAAVYGAAITTGQRCSATSRLIADARIAEPLFERVAVLMRQLRVGYGASDDVFMGPLVSQVALERHREVLEMASREADCCVEGGPVEGPKRGFYVRPSFHRVRRFERSRYQLEEHFVPDLAGLVVSDLDEGIAALDATDYGLVASVFSRDREPLEQVFRAARVGLLNWNTSTVGASSRLPFGGVKRSGNDRPAGAASALYCTYPVASTEIESPASEVRAPGFPART